MPQVLLLPGWHNSGPDHWQSLWQLEHGYVRVEQHAWDRPLRGDWMAQLEEAVLAAPAPVVLVAHGGLIAALTAALLDLPVDNWPVLGGMGNASWVQLSGHGAADADVADIRWRLDVWNASAQVANDVL